MELEEQFATCLLMVGPPPEHSVLEVHRETSKCLRQSQTWRGEVRIWFHNHVLKERFPIMAGMGDAAWSEWIEGYLNYLREKRDEAQR